MRSLSLPLRLLAFTAVVLLCVGSFAAGWRMRFHHLPAPIVCDGVTCAQIAERAAEIGNEIAASANTPHYLAIGDSLTEAVTLPVLCGRVGINAGIAGATTQTFLGRAKGLAASARPDFVVLDLGTNDGVLGRIDGLRDRLTTLIAALAPYPVILVPPSQGPRVPHAAELQAVVASMSTVKANAVSPDPNNYVDGVHYNALGIKAWDRALDEAAARLLGADCRAQ